MHRARLGALLLVATAATPSGLDARAERRSAISVADMVSLAVFGDPEPELGKDSAILWAPGRQAAAILVSGGDASTGTNRATLYHYLAGQGDAPGTLRRLVELRSATSTRPIAQVQWLADGATIVFKGADAAGLPQIYKVDVGNGSLTRLTQEKRAIRRYDITPSGGALVLTLPADPPLAPADNAECRTSGCRVDAETLQEAEQGISADPDVMVLVDLRQGSRRVIDNPATLDPDVTECRDGRGGGISPDGNYILRLCRLRQSAVPTWWKDYSTYPGLREAVAAGSTSHLRQWLLVDLRRNRTRRLSSAPFFAGNTPAQPVWLKDGKLILPAAFEPLDIAEPGERARRASHYAALLYDPGSDTVQRIGFLPDRSEKAVRASWDADRETLVVETARTGSAQLQSISFRRSSLGWVAGSSPNPPPELPPSPLAIEQSPNDRPVLVERSARAGARRVLLDPNAWLAGRRLGEVRAISWRLASGATWQGQLYLPVGYVARRRYPLVIQTHGIRAGIFSLEGYSSNFAAQPMAGRGMMVLQVGEDIGALQGVAEFEAAQDGYESAVRSLSDQGMIDPARVGIIGWSRTGPYVGYTLTRSHVHFAAAAMTETADFGWWWYLTTGARHGESEYGAPPFGKGLDIWRNHAPSFNLDKVRTPMFLWSAGPVSGLWDWYAVLRRLGKPVEYWNLPDGEHQLYKTRERLRMNQLLVDWFAFWLTGEEAPERDADRWARWRKMRSPSP